MEGRIRTICLSVLLAVVVSIGLQAATPAVPSRMTLLAAGASDQDDMAFWLHPTDLSRSTVITSDKAANRLFVYDLEGKTLQVIPARRPGNIDTRYGFRLAGEWVDIVAFNERDTNKIRVYKVNALSRRLEQVDDGNIDSGPNYGFTLYKSQSSGRLYAFSSAPGSFADRLWAGSRVKQFELVDAGHGRVSARGPLRRLRVGSQVEGMVADDEQGRIYVAEEAAGIWQFDAEPDVPSAGKRIVSVGENGLTADVEGLAMYYLPDGQGYLIASSQGTSTFSIYERQSPHRFVGTFALAGVSHTDGIDVINLPLAAFSQGVFAGHNGRSHPYPVQLVSWADIATALKLKVDTGYWDPRRTNPSGG